MRLFVLGWFVLATMDLPVRVCGQLPLARLHWVFPPGAAVGSTTELRVAGTDLDGPDGLIFSDPRITATLKPGTLDRFDVTVPAAVPEGLVDVRFVGRFGASNPRAFAVGARDEFIAPATNTSPARAIELPLDTTVNGHISAGTTAWFKFQAATGQRLIVRAQARALDSRLVPDLMIYDGDHRERAVTRRREWLDFTVPAEGSYRLKLQDQTFRGGEEFFYRLTLSTGPHLDNAQPVVLRVGTTNHVTVFGRNLPGGALSSRRGADGSPLEQVDAHIIVPNTPSPLTDVAGLLFKPASAALAPDAFSWQMTGNGMNSHPLLFALTTHNTATGSVNEVSLVTPPCEFSALFPARGEVSGVMFQAAKGDVFWLELFSDRLGFPTDPHAVVQRERATRGERGETLFADVLEWGDTEANLGDREFPTTTRDAAARFEAPQTGTYRVLVRDRFNLDPIRPRYPYLLSIRPAKPDFRLVALPMPPPRAGEDRKIQVMPLTVRREETLALKVLAFRRDGFDGEIQLTASGLPSGVTAGAARILEGQNTGTLLLTASREAAGVAPITLEGTAVVGTNTLTRPCPLASVLWAVPDFNNEHAHSRLNREAVLSVVAVEQAPVSVAAAGIEAIEAPGDGTLSVPLLVTRRGDFNAAFNLKPAGHPALDKVKEFTVPDNATHFTAEIKLAETKLPAGTHTLWFQGVVTGKYRNHPEAIALAEAELKMATEALAAASATDQPKAAERKQAAEAAKKAAEERAKPRDVTVPVYSAPVVVRVLSAVPPRTTP